MTRSAANPNAPRLAHPATEATPATATVATVVAARAEVEGPQAIGPVPNAAGKSEREG